MDRFICHREYGETVREIMSGGSDLNIAVSYWSEGILKELSIDELTMNRDSSTVRIICDLENEACHYEPIEKLIESRIQVKSFPSLHAKVWSTAELAILGSANASRAALHFSTVDSGSRNVEAGVRITQPQILQSLNTWFEDLWKSEECVKVTYFDVQQEKRKKRRKQAHNRGRPQMIETQFPAQSVILDSVRSWKTECLINGQSLFTNLPLWSLGLFEELNNRITNVPKRCKFQEFVPAVLNNASKESCKLMAELYWIFCLIHQVTPDSKLHSFKLIWDMSGDPMPPDEHDKFDILRRDYGFVNKGQSLSQKPAAVRYLICLMTEFFRESRKSRRKLVDSYEAFGQLADNVYNLQRSQAKHIIMFLMFPRLFLSIINTDHKRDIATYRPFRQYLGTSELSLTPSSFEIDLRLNAIRYNLECERGAPINFYDDNCFNGWRYE
ncbi:MAG: phospholipase D family protein [Gammaproteobacteria bacterium]|nr:phospholipase D family protein [Gammaproteobacteria bacterium]